MRNAIHFLGGSISVYLLMAACSAGSKHGSGSGNERPQSTANQGGMGTSTAGTEAIANAGTSMPNGTSGELATASGGIGGMIDDMMDPVDDAEAAPTNGTRLKARYFVGEDGSRQPVLGWRDTKRNEDCFFQKAEDGKLHCMPSVGAYALTYFGDQDCTAQPLTLVAKTAPACAAAPTPVPSTLYVSEACGANRMLYTVGQTPVTPVYQKSGANCIALQQALLDIYNFYPMMAPVAAPASAFVAATEQVE